MSVSVHDRDQSDISAYYQHSGSVPLASKVSFTARRKMFELFMKELRPDRSMRVLDVGVTSDTAHAESNYFEKMYPYPHQITCVGTENGSHLEREFPGLQYLQVKPGEPLPFQSREFDLVFSNAVIEHVGSRKAQADFAAELCRVGSKFFITTPNRWFPVEHHTGIPFLHFLPAASFRMLIRNTRFRYWSTEDTLNLLTAEEFARLFPRNVNVQVQKISIGGIASNLAAFGTTQR